MAPLVVIGVGSDFRGDDAAGLLAARSLSACRLVHALEHHGDGLSLMERWRPADHVVIVDALVSGHSPGTVFRFEATGEPLPGDAGWVSSHSLGVAQGIETARALGRLPASLTVYGIEAGRLDPGSSVTPEVAEAAGQVARTILDGLAV